MYPSIKIHHKIGAFIGSAAGIAEGLAYTRGMDTTEGFELALYIAVSGLYTGLLLAMLRDCAVEFRNKMRI